MDWAQPEYDRTAVNQAGKVLRLVSDGSLSIAEADNFNRYMDSVRIANNWRSSHAYPLNTFQINLRGVVKRFDDEPVVAQRIKRLVSIERKLQLIPEMRLSQIQDLGGCRGIVQNVRNVRSVEDYYRNHSSIEHGLVKTDDYISGPKESGYRGVHLVYQYSSATRPQYTGLKIEIQLRSRYQHAWATAVETVGMFSGQALKSSLGSEDWKRFFSLMGSMIAFREKQELVPGTPTNRAELIEELKAYADRLRVVQRLGDYRNVMNLLMGSGKTQSSDHFFLLELDPTTATPQLEISAFTRRQSALAEEKYAEAEQLVRENPSRDAVLVSVDSLTALSKAYPNYFADTRVFLGLLTQTISGKPRSIREPSNLVDRLRATSRRIA